MKMKQIDLEDKSQCTKRSGAKLFKYIFLLIATFLTDSHFLD